MRHAFIGIYENIYEVSTYLVMVVLLFPPIFAVFRGGGGIPGVHFFVFSPEKGGAKYDHFSTTIFPAEWRASRPFAYQMEVFLELFVGEL